MFLSFVIYLIIGIIDKVSQMWNTGFCGYGIYPPDSLNLLKPDKVILTIYHNNEEIYANLKQEFLQKYPEIELGENIINPL